MNERQALYDDRFNENLTRYSSISERIQRRIQRILADPYAGTEPLRNFTDGLDLRGFRSARVGGGGGFRVIFVVCEEYWQVKEYRFPLCEGQEDATVIFLTVGPHDAAYAME